MRVLYVVFDTLRADHLGCYGYFRPTSPNVDRMASEGVLFSNAYPTDVPTQPSYTAMFSGQRGITTGVVSHADEHLSDDAPWFPQLLAFKCYTTAAVSTLSHMKKWFARGFQYYMNPVAGDRKLTQRVTADQINSIAIPWLRSNWKDDFFMFVHYWDVHTIYAPPERYRRLYYQGNEKDPSNHSLDGIKENIAYPFVKRLLDAMGEGITDIEYVIAQYDAEITYADEKFGELIATLEELNILEDTLIIVTSDHGESLGEHNIYFDHAAVYEPTAHVPLIFRHPDLPSGKRIEALVQLIDIAPTVLEYFEVDIPQELEGKSLWPLLNGERTEQYDQIFTNQGLWQATRMMRTKRWKLIKCIDNGFWDLPSTELYDLQSDPKELHNLAEERKEIVDELELKLHRWVAERLGKRTDPLRRIAEKGLPPKKSLKKLLEEEKGTYDEWRRKMGW